MYLGILSDELSSVVINFKSLILLYFQHNRL